MSASASMDETSLTFSKTTAIETSEDIVEQELLVQRNDIDLIDFVDQNIKKLHVSNEEGVAISDGVCVRSSPGKLRRQQGQTISG